VWSEAVPARALPTAKASVPHESAREGGEIEAGIAVVRARFALIESALVLSAAS
jgi:hypothetical protein